MPKLNLGLTIEDAISLVALLRAATEKYRETGLGDTAADLSMGIGAQICGVSLDPDDVAAMVNILELYGEGTEDMDLLTKPLTRMFRDELTRMSDEEYDEYLIQKRWEEAKDG
jgi:hypothetical protein